MTAMTAMTAMTDLSDVVVQKATGEAVTIGALVDRPTIVVALRYYG